MSVKVEVKMDVQSMVDFMTYHIYSGAVGIGSFILGGINIGLTMAFAMKGKYLFMGLFLIFALIIFFIFPYIIKRKVERQMQNSRRLDIPVTYEFDDYVIETTTPDDSGKASWSKFKRAVSKKRIIILYDAQKRAIILPVDQMAEEYTAVVDMIYAHMPAPAVRIRRLDKKR